MPTLLQQLEEVKQKANSELQKQLAKADLPKEIENKILDEIEKQQAK